jgi:TonB family protein
MRPHALLVGLITFFFTTVGFSSSWPPPDVTSLVERAPKPEYPPAAGRHGIRGSGVFLMRVHIPSWRVTQVIFGRSTGDKLLDSAAVKALRSWRFKPGAAPYVKITTVKMSPPQGKDETLVKVPISFGE